MNRWEALLLTAVLTSGSAFGISTSTSVSDLVLTPAGLRPRALVHRLEPGERLRGTGAGVDVLDWADRLVVGIARSVPLVPSLTRSGWISDAAYTVPSGEAIASFRSTWQVPPEPTSRSGQTIFYFNGIENAAHSNILQPVLQWGSAADGGGDYWAIASWYVGVDGTFYTDPIPVKAGDTLVGVMTRTAKEASGFSYTSEFEGVAGTSLPVDNIDELVWLNETLEAYGVGDCSDYPPAGTDFKAIDLQTSGGQPSLQWQTQNRVTGCGEHTVIVSDSVTDGEVDIFTH